VNTDLFVSIAKQLSAAAGAVLVSRGMATNSDVNTIVSDLPVIIGAVMGIAPIIVSIVQHGFKKKS
jgi:hypothetical protein